MAKPQGYQIILEKRAKKEAGNIPPPQRHRIDKAIRSLSVNPRSETYERKGSAYEKNFIYISSHINNHIYGKFKKCIFRCRDKGNET